jgi:hypothetical protein
MFNWRAWFPRRATGAAQAAHPGYQQGCDCPLRREYEMTKELLAQMKTEFPGRGDSIGNFLCKFAPSAQGHIAEIFFAAKRAALPVDEVLSGLERVYEEVWQHQSAEVRGDLRSTEVGEENHLALLVIYEKFDLMPEVHI